MTTQEIRSIFHELTFWKTFVTTPRFLKGWVNNERTPELRDSVYQFLKERPEAEVLDVGSGVVSILTGSCKKLMAVDPLGELYGMIFDYQKYRALQPIAIPAEELNFPGTFDIVHISNALDHTQDPIKAFDSMFACVKPGGHLIIQSFENEATYENWQGFHQVNISLDGAVLKSNGYPFADSLMVHSNFTVIHAEKIEVELNPGNKRNWIIWIAQKAV